MAKKIHLLSVVIPKSACRKRGLNVKMRENWLNKAYTRLNNVRLKKCSKRTKIKTHFK